MSNWISDEFIEQIKNKHLRFNGTKILSYIIIFLKTKKKLINDREVIGDRL